MESRIEERFYYKDYPCVVMFQPMGFRTGYVGLPKDSILYGRNSTILNTILECHGGVTYTESRLYGQEDENTWWVGFDCGHAWDGYDADTTWKYFRKDISDYKRIYDGEIRTREYVENECRSLVEQIQNSNNLTELDIVIKVFENSYEDMSDVAVKYLKEYRSKLEREKVVGWLTRTRKVVMDDGGITYME